MMVDGVPDKAGTEEPMSDDEPPADEEDDIIQPEGMPESEEVEDMSERTLNAHSGSVFCVAISKSEQFVLSGGEDDSAIIWDISGEDTTSQKIEGHKDSVTHVGFSPNDKYYFTADLAGFIQLFELSSHKKIWEFEVGDVLWVMWHPLVPILLAGAVEGGVWMWKVPDFETKTIQLSSAPPVDAVFMSTNRHLVVGYQDGVVKVINLKSGEATMSCDTRGEITSVGVSRDDNVIMVGSPVSSISLIAAQSGKVIASLSEHPAGYTPPTDAPSDSVEHITFHPSRTLAAVSYVNDRVCLWDVGLQRLRTTLPHPDGVVKCSWAGDSDHHLVTCCLDGVVRVWDVDQNEVLVEVTGHAAQLLDMEISENLVVTADDAGSVKVFRIS